MSLAEAFVFLLLVFVSIRNLRFKIKVYGVTFLVSINAFKYMLWIAFTIISIVWNLLDIFVAKNKNLFNGRLKWSKKQLNYHRIRDHVFVFHIPH